MCLQVTHLFEVCYEQVAFSLIAGAIYLLLGMAPTGLLEPSIHPQNKHIILSVQFFIILEI